MKTPAVLLKICDLSSVGMVLARPRFSFIIILTSLHLNSGDLACLKQALVSPLCGYMARAFFNGHSSLRGIKRKVIEPSAPGGDDLNSSSI